MTAIKKFKVAAHLSPLAVAAIVSIIVGRPLGWVAFFAPLGPLLVVAAATLAKKPVEPTWRMALAFSIVCAFMIGGSWALMAASNQFPPIAVTFPLALLAFLLGLLNFVMVSISRTVRAWKSIPLDYPWIPNWLDRPLGLTQTLKEM